MKKDWIKNLPPGEYDMHFLKKFAGLTSHTSIKRMMIKYGANAKLVRCENTHFFKDIFYWPGFKHENQHKKVT